MSRDWSPREKFIWDFILDNQLSNSKITMNYLGNSEVVYDSESTFSKLCPNLSFIIGEESIKDIEDTNLLYLLYIENRMAREKDMIFESVPDLVSQNGKTYEPKDLPFWDNKYIEGFNTVSVGIKTRKYFCNFNESYYQDRNKEEYISFLHNSSKEFAENLLNNICDDMIKMSNQGMSLLEITLAVENEFSGLLDCLNYDVKDETEFGTSIDIEFLDNNKFTISINNDGNKYLPSINIPLISGEIPEELLKANEIESFEQLSLF